ncbi:MAG TPA: hypothetical protein VFX76_17070, partial [Roseiflexaceae bacterium]|nr:hypothetical protein [Roseiflexaceae bacterium]
MPRLITRNLRRAFPELDELEDWQCDRYIALAKGDIGCLYHAFPPMVTIGACFLCGYLLVRFGRKLGLPSLSQMGSIETALFVFALLSYQLGLPLIAGLASRDLLLWGLLRRHVRNRLERSRCLNC